MNKIEEILCRHVASDKLDDYIVGCYLSDIKGALVEFGKLAFEAGRTSTSPVNKEGFVHETYKDYLKEIEDETGD